MRIIFTYFQYRVNTCVVFTLNCTNELEQISVNLCNVGITTGKYRELTAKID